MAKFISKNKKISILLIKKFGKIDSWPNVSVGSPYILLKKFFLLNFIGIQSYQSFQFKYLTGSIAT